MIQSGNFTPPVRSARGKWPACLLLALVLVAARTSARETPAPLPAPAPAAPPATAQPASTVPAPGETPTRRVDPPLAPAAPTSGTALEAPATPAAAPIPSTQPNASRPPPAAVPPSAPTTTPATADLAGLIKLGTSLADRGDYAAAEIAFHQALRNPQAPDADLRAALLGLARMHRKQGAFTKAAAVYERFLKDYSHDERAPDALLELGRTLRALGTHRLAIARFYSVLNSTLKITSEHFDHYQLLAKTAQFEIAQTHFDSGEFAEAAKFFHRLRMLDLAPADHARAHFMVACSQRLEGDREAAVTTLRAFIEQSPDDANVPEARSLLALTLRELGRPQEAFAATLELLRVEKARTNRDPKQWAYWQRRTGNQLANDFYESGDTINAKAIYAGLLELSADPVWRLPIMYQLGLCAERLGLSDEARTSYQGVIDAAKAAAGQDFAELVRMASWRLEHLGWREHIGRQIAAHFPPPAGPAVPGKAPASPPANALP